MGSDLIDVVKVRDIREDYTDEVYQFIVREQGDAEIGCVEEYVQAS